MTKRTGLLALVVLAMLAACSKSPTPDKPSVADAAKAAPPPAMDPAQKAAGLLTLIDTAPQCQGFRTELETAGKAPNATGAELNAIVAKAGAAGCTTKPGTP